MTVSDPNLRSTPTGPDAPPLRNLLCAPRVRLLERLPPQLFLELLLFAPRPQRRTQLGRLAFIESLLHPREFLFHI